MALTLIATPGASDANTYITLADAETFFEKRLHKSAWENAWGPDKNAALVWATRLLDEKIEWDGLKVSSSQALAWPRQLVYDPEGYLLDSALIPDFLAQATAEFAMWLLNEDRSAEAGTKGISEIKAGPITLKINPSDRAPVIPAPVWSMVSFYAKKRQRNTRTLRLQ